MKSKTKNACMLALLVTAAANAQDYRGYAGKGGMGAHEIEPHVYEYHYDHGFVGEDAMGWDSDLQFAWSRLAAVRACDISSAPQTAVIGDLVERYGQSVAVHEVVGIEFHAAQIQANPAFCTAKRKAEAVQRVSELERGGLSAPTVAASSAPAGSVAAEPVSTKETVPNEMLATTATPVSVQSPVASAMSTAAKIPLTYRAGGGESGRNLGDDVLRVVRRAHTGRAVGLQVLTGALLGGVGGVGFGKAQLHGEKIKTIPNPGRDALQAMLRGKLDNYFSRHPDAMPPEPMMLQILGHDWLLIYQELDNENAPYELRYSTNIAAPPKKNGFLRFERSPVAMQCKPEARVALLDQWQADDYAMVKATAGEYAAQCAAEFEERLPAWFPAPPPA